jgi:hypothetical protein
MFNILLLLVVVEETNLLAYDMVAVVVQAVIVTLRLGKLLEGTRQPKHFCLFFRQLILLLR